MEIKINGIQGWQQAASIVRDFYILKTKSPDEEHKMLLIEKLKSVSPDVYAKHLTIGLIIKAPILWWYSFIEDFSDCITTISENDPIMEILEKEGDLTEDDFDWNEERMHYEGYLELDILMGLNSLKHRYERYKYDGFLKDMREILPCGYLQERHFETTYAGLNKIYHSDNPIYQGLRDYLEKMVPESWIFTGKEPEAK